MKRKADIRAAAMVRIEHIAHKPDKELAEAVRQIVKDTQAELEAFKAETSQAEAERLMAKAAKPPQFPAY
jgi:hypothetical protein